MGGVCEGEGGRKEEGVRTEGRTRRAQRGGPKPRVMRRDMPRRDCVLTVRVRCAYGEEAGGRSRGGRGESCTSASGKPLPPLRHLHDKQVREMSDRRVR